MNSTPTRCRDNLVKNRREQRKRRLGLSLPRIGTDVMRSSFSERPSGPRGAILSPSEGSARSAASCSTAWMWLSRNQSVKNRSKQRKRSLGVSSPGIGTDFIPNTEVNSTRGSGESRDSDPGAVHGSRGSRPGLPFLTPSCSASSACSCSSVSEFELRGDRP
jgi:hypothetical protein